MRNKTYTSFFLGLACTLITVSGCKKSPKTFSRLTQINETLAMFPGKVTTTDIQYNTDGSVMAFNGSGLNGQNKLFDNRGNTILVRTYDLPNTYRGMDSLTLNSAGYLVNLRSFTTYKTDWLNWVYNRNTNNELLGTHHTSSSGGVDITEGGYIYQDGNLVQDQTFKYDYDLGKAAGLGDYFSLQLFKAYGLTYNTSKNLVVRATTAHDTINIKYKFDEHGRIIELSSYNKNALVYTDTYIYTNLPY